MKRLVILTILLCMLSGCSNIGAAELGERLIIEAIGVDTNDEGYTVTVLALNTQQTGSANSTDTPDGVAKIFSSSADTLSAAFADIDLISGQIPLYSQTRVLILGRELAENCPMNAMNYFLREYTTRDDVLVAVSDTTAAEILRFRPGKNELVSKTIHSILRSGKFNGMTLTMPIYKFINNLVNTTDSAALPILTLQKNLQADREEIDLKGTALFASRTWTATLNAEDSKGMLIASDDFDSGPLEVEFKNEKISLAIQRCKSKIRYSNDNGPHFTITISFSSDIIEYNAPQRKNLDMKTLESVRKLSEEKMISCVENFIENAMRNNGCDCLSFGRILKNKDPAEYETAIADFSKFLKNVPVTVFAESKITRTGKEILPFE